MVNNPCFKWLQKRITPKNGKMRITDLKLSCLESVFDHLEMSDLLNVADSNERLKKAAGMVFLRRYSDKKVWLHKPRLSTKPKLRVYSANIMIEDLKTSLQILRCFGDLIFKLEITEDEVSSDWEFTEKFGIYQIIHNSIMDYVNRFCATSLKELALIMVPKSALDHLKRPFVSLETVHLFSCRLGKELMPLDELFPAIQNLTLDFNLVENPLIIEEHWRRLKHFEVNIDRWNIQKKNVEEMLRLNPKLQSLKISSGWDAEILQSASKFLQLIEHLEIGNHFGGFSALGEKVIHFVTVKKLKISLIGAEPSKLQKLPLSFNQLEEFELETNHELDGEFFEFLRQNPLIKKLTVPSLPEHSTQTPGEKFEFRKELNPLTEIDVSRYLFNADSAIDFITECKVLKKFRFRIESVAEYDDLLIQLCNVWQASIDENRFVELERTPIESFVNYIHDFLDNLQFRQVYHY